LLNVISSTLRFVQDR